jgi:hypothetical protein
MFKIRTSDVRIIWSVKRRGIVKHVSPTHWWLGRISPYLVWLLTFQSSVDVILVIGGHPIVVWDRKYLDIGRVQRIAWILIFRVFVGVSELEVRCWWIW